MRSAILSDREGAGEPFMNVQLTAPRTPFNPILPRAMRIMHVCDVMD